MTQRLHFHGRNVAGTSAGHPIPVAIASQKEFTAGNMQGVSGGLGYYWPTGRLPEPWRSRFDQADRDNQIVYVVYSYRTPIAWWTTDGHYVQPDVKYSATTSRHQRYSRLAQPPTTTTERTAVLNHTNRGTHVMTNDNDTFTYQVANAQDAATDTWSDTYTAAWQDGYKAARNGTAPRPDTTTDGAEQAGYRQGIADALTARHQRPVVDIDHNHTPDDTTTRASINC